MIINRIYRRRKTIKLILASGSQYRKNLLQRLNLPFSCISPEIDESPLPKELPEPLVLRLAEAKAEKVASLVSEALIIGSDQVATLAGKILGKPGGYEQANRQLTKMSGRCVSFYTGLCVFNSISGKKQSACILNDVHIRQLSAQEIDRYLISEEPYQCAGSFKSEALGITLIEQIDGPDPTALIGLPLIKLSEMLRNEKYNLP